MLALPLRVSSNFSRSSLREALKPAEAERRSFSEMRGVKEKVLSG